MLWSSIINGKAGVRGGLNDLGATPKWPDAELLQFAGDIIEKIVAMRPDVKLDADGFEVEFVRPTVVTDAILVPDRFARALRVGIVACVNEIKYADTKNGMAQTVQMWNAFNDEVARA